MKPWVEIARASAPGVGVSLHRRDAEFVIRAGGNVLMSSRQHGSEERLAEIGCAGLGPSPRVLVGGLGMGFTLRAVLDVLPAGGAAVVAELLPEIIEWNRTVLAPLAGHPLDDPRVEVHAGDVAEAIRGDRFDAILLDVDNGPDGLTRPQNEGLYREAGLVAARRALRPGGRLAIWSAARARQLERRMERAGFEVRTAPVRGRGRRGSVHIIHLGVRPHL